MGLAPICCYGRGPETLESLRQYALLVGDCVGGCVDGAGLGDKAGDCDAVGNSVGDCVVGALVYAVVVDEWAIDFIDVSLSVGDGNGDNVGDSFVGDSMRKCGRNVVVGGARDAAT